MFKCFPLLNACGGKAEALDKRHCSLHSVPDEVLRSSKTLEECLLDANQIKELPKKLFASTQLKRLTLSDNGLMRIPPNIGNLNQLVELDLSRNEITDFPENIKFCEHLRVLDISSNPIQSLPDGFCHLRNLQQANLNDISLAQLNPDFGNLTALRKLEMRDNALKSLPISFSKLQSLEFLDLGGNEFCELPAHIGHLANLTELFLDTNELRVLPQEIGRLKRLAQLDVSENFLESLPEEIGGLVSLTDLSLTQNSLDMLPDGIGNLRQLTILKLDQNRLMAINPKLGQCLHLNELFLTENLLSTFPPSIGQLSQLINLNADRNRLAELPPEIGGCQRLNILTLRDNRLHRLPSELGHLSQLHVLDLAGNKLDRLPMSLTECPLRALWLSEKQSQPIIRLQTDTDPVTGEEFLTCYLLPQEGFEPSQTPIPPVMPRLHSSGSDQENRNSHRDSRLKHPRFDRRQVDGPVIQHSDNKALTFAPKRVSPTDEDEPDHEVHDVPTSPTNKSPLAQNQNHDKEESDDDTDSDSSSSSETSDSEEDEDPLPPLANGTTDSKKAPLSPVSLPKKTVTISPAEPPKKVTTSPDPPVVIKKSGVNFSPDPPKNIIANPNVETPKREVVKKVTIPSPEPVKKVTVAKSPSSQSSTSSTESDYSSSSESESDSETESEKTPKVEANHHQPVVEPEVFVKKPEATVQSKVKLPPPVPTKPSLGLTPPRKSMDEEMSSGGEEIDQLRHVEFADEIEDNECKTPSLRRRDTPHYNKNARITKQDDPQFVIKVIEKYRRASGSDEPLVPEPILASPVVRQLKFAPPTQHKIVIDRTPGLSLGISIAGGLGSSPWKQNDHSIFISKVAEDKPAYEAGLRLGDRLLEVNEQTMIGIEHKDAVTAMKKCGNQMRLLVEREAKENAEQRLTVNLVRVPGSSLGFSITGGAGTADIAYPNDSIYVSRVTPGQVADKAGLQVGDRLVAVAGEDVSSSRREDVVALLTVDLGTIPLTVVRAPVLVKHAQPPVPEEDEDYPVETIILRREGQPMGLSICGGADYSSYPFGGDEPGVFINKIVVNSAASKTALRVGDRLLKVNAKDVRNALHADVVAALVENESMVELTVRHDPLPRGVTTTVQGDRISIVVSGDHPSEDSAPHAYVSQPQGV